jgi:hypothetical protein
MWVCPYLFEARNNNYLLLLQAGLAMQASVRPRRMGAMAEEGVGRVRTYWSSGRGGCTGMENFFLHIFIFEFTQDYNSCI